MNKALVQFRIPGAENRLRHGIRLGHCQSKAAPPHLRSQGAISRRSTLRYQMLQKRD
ncbi:hypothetical protein [Sandarakinorhabdus limnophila]|uniref:hypothetical protein n=1 Tax=Sandarakinorhabdus limnophila TaxID=210512 RepID=UPI0026ED9F97|nr:hypothetical protein [Sandarakinorhabdus limnophila]MCM0033908.1 hypothetical protein [Sandarakinorhabdus limnophila]